MDGFDDVGIRVNIVLHSANRTSVSEELLHPCAGARISQSEIIEHGEVSSTETPVCVLNGFHIRAELVGVVRHVDHGHVRQLCRSCLVSFNSGDHGGRCGDGALHEGVHVLPRCHRGRLRIFHHLCGGIAVQRLDTACELFKFRVSIYGLCGDSADTCRDCTDCGCANSGCCAKSACECRARSSSGRPSCFLTCAIQFLADGASCALHRWNDQDVGSCDFACHLSRASLLFFSIHL